jgi:hypothetical protein
MMLELAVEGGLEEEEEEQEEKEISWVRPSNKLAASVVSAAPVELPLAQLLPGIAGAAAAPTELTGAELKEKLMKSFRAFLNKLM